MERPTKVTRENITRHLIEYELAMVGKTMMDTLDDDRWYFNITMTPEQYVEFKKYAIRLIKKVFKCNTGRATDTFQWFNLAFGLRVKG
jgi:hypothetical protein